jgi:hypothetical protein
VVGWEEAEHVEGREGRGGQETDGDVESERGEGAEDY